MHRPTIGRSAPLARPRRCALLALSLLIGACTTAVSPVQVPRAQVAEAEARHARNPTDPRTRVELGVVYVQSGRAAEAAALLEPVATLPQGPPNAAFYLGLAYEMLDRTADARRQYETYLQRGAPSDLKRRVRSRLALLDRRDLELAVSVALAGEQALAATDPPPRSIGVFPFVSGLGEDMRSLGRAFAELLSTDLAQTDRLTVVERAQVQLLLEEIRLAETGAVDPQTAARAGRLLGAGRILQGRLDGSEAALRIQAMVVPVPAPAAGQATPLIQEGALRELFDLQTNLAFDVYHELGIELTAAERERIARRPTQNVQALLAFGFGLEAEDARRYTDAASHYNRALRLDPGFDDARAAFERAVSKGEAGRESIQALATDGALEFHPDLVPRVQRRERFAGVEQLVTSPQQRDPVAEFLGVEGFERRALLELIIRRPGGTE